MRLAIEAAEAGNARPPARAEPVRARRDPLEFALLGLFAVLSLWTVGVDVAQAIVHGQVWTGTDGIYIVDQMQYLAWIQSASHHFVAANLFVLRPTPADYFQPAVTISAGLSALGLAPWLALLVWKPVAVVTAFFGLRAYVHRSLDQPRARRIALALALFFGSFTVSTDAWMVIGDLMAAFLSWGYTFGLLALALMVLSLVAYERGRERPGVVVLPGVLGALAALLHPWQGELEIVILIAAELAALRFGPAPGRLRSVRQRLTTPLITVILCALPLLYYELLGRTDLSWRLARDASKHTFSLWAILLATAPLIVPALAAWRPPKLDFLAVITRVWPVAALIVWVLSSSQLSATPLHAFEGVTLPLSVLAVQGIGRVRLPSFAPKRVATLAAVVVFTVPATVYLMTHVRSLVKPASGNPNFISKPEYSALRYLARDRQAGGVLTRFYLGTVVPAQTGRRTFVGDCLWSEPYCSERAIAVQAVFDGVVPVDLARELVVASRARFVLTDCQDPAPLSRTLAPMLVSVHHFGCAAVYELRPPAAWPPPLTKSLLDAVVRASGRQ